MRETLGRRVSLIPAILFALILLVELITIYSINDGRLIYTLDDAYIHLALAENIGEGHYGINPGEAAAPSSSILWPFLLAGFSVPFGEFAPLLFNILAAAVTLYVYGRICSEALRPGQDTRRQWAVVALTILLIPATNLIGLIFTGMEHSLQLLLVSLIVLGLIIESQTGQVPWWLPFVIIIAPIVRYESLAISLPALIYLAFRKHSWITLLGGIVIAVLLGGFSALLVSLGLGALPNSVLAKSGVLLYGGGARAILFNLYQNITTVPGLLLLLSLIMLLIAAFGPVRRRAERLLAAALSVAILIHLLMGTMDGYHRYEIYIWAAACLTLIYLYRENLVGLVSGQSLIRPGFVFLLFLLLASREYATVLLTNPLASNNIYEQQHQMHRFATEYYRRPVAVVDLGWVGYGNGQYVLDLWGLASSEALEKRLSESDPSWMDRLAQENDVKLAMIYDFRFARLPENWTKLGALRLGRSRWTVADDQVSFYALDDDSSEKTRLLLLEFRESLPPGVTFDFADEEG